MKKRMASLSLALALCFSLLSPAASAAAEQSSVLHIASAEELRSFAADCTFDEYSVGLSVVLDCDIDLGDEEFTPIPSFSGSFDGGGHTISGFTLATDGSHQGLFRYLQSGGEIKNLNVSGTVEPDNSRCQVGGIVGTSYGSISGCSFDGRVSGLNYIGGIVGENYGEISSCSASGSVSGKRYTGGIAGISYGTIASCSNSADVNIEISEGGIEVDSLSISGVTGLSLTGAEDTDVVSDSGGIVGMSSGLVENCENSGSVGYPHYGYNVGGIAGRQSGTLRGCENSGEIYGRKDVGGIVGQMEPYLLLEDTESIAEEIQTLQYMIDAALANSDAMSDDLVDALQGVNGSASSALDNLLPADSDDIELPDLSTELQSENSSADSEASSSGDGSRSSASAVGGSASSMIRSSSDSLSGLEGSTSASSSDSSDDLADMDKELDNLANVMLWSSDVLNSDIGGIAAQVSKVMLMLTELMSGGLEVSIYDDVSLSEPEGSTEGRVSACVNRGSVEGDTNVGGIAGDMGIEYEFDLENELVSTISSGNTVTSTYLTKCISSGNANYGSISGRKNCVGGIVGQSQLGLIEECENYGGAESEEGSYVGGIVGNSMSAVQRCYSMCALSGEEYVGGIAGCAVEMHDCVSIVETDGVTACFGAVAGYAELDRDSETEDDAESETEDETESAISGNVFVGEDMGGIDGISYAGIAEPISYSAMLKLEGLPEDFGKLRLSFVADGELVGELYFDYGGSVDLSDVPEVPEKEGYTGVWDDFENSNLRFSMTVEAVYTPLQAALAADYTRDDSPQSVVLVEGSFGGKAKLHLAPYSGDGPSSEYGETLEKWALLVEGSETDEYSVRFLEPEHTMSSSSIDIYVYDGTDWVKADTSTDGSYIVFDASGESVVFAAVERKGAVQLGLMIGIPCAAAAAAAAIIIVRRRKKKSTSAAAEAPAPAAAGGGEDS